MTVSMLLAKHCLLLLEVLLPLLRLGSGFRVLFHILLLLKYRLFIGKFITHFFSHLIALNKLSFFLCKVFFTVPCFFFSLLFAFIFFKHFHFLLCCSIFGFSSLIRLKFGKLSIEGSFLLLLLSHLILVLLRLVEGRDFFLQ